MAREPAFREYAERVRSQDPGEGAAERALATVKAALAGQRAVAADNNRRINQRRARWRTQAGPAILGSVLAVLVLVGVGVVLDLDEDSRHHRGRGARA